MRDRKKAARRPLPAKKAAISRNGRGPTSLSANDTRLAEALAQQAATADILRIIATSRTDAQPVFDAIAESAARLCTSYDAAIYRLEADRLVLAAHHGPIVLGRVGEFSLPVQGSVAGHAIRKRRAIQVSDAQAVGHRYPVTGGHAPRMGVRTMLCVPLLLNGVAVGAFSLRRTEVQRFTTRQIALLRTFADQAVIAIENARLFRETQEHNRNLTESLEREKATGEILRVINSSPNDLQPVFDIIAKSATVLCGAEVGAVTRFDGELVHMVAVYGSSRRGVEVLRKAFPLPPGGQSVSARAIRDRALVHIPDVLTEPGYGIREAAVASGFRAAFGVPMLREGRALGAIVVGRGKVGPFSEHEIDLLRTFADQAVIAIENVRLFQEVNDRNRDLTESLERETATGEILRAISSSPNDLQPVFDIIAKSAAILCGAEASTVARYDGELVHMVAIHGSSRRGVDALRRAFPRPPSGETASARAIRDRAIVHIPDVLTEPEYGIQNAAVASGFRAALGVPMLRDGRALGAIAVGRSKVGPFSEREIDLLRTFADQAVIAIENVRLFQELGTKNRDLTESLEQQTATGEILRVISSSPTDVQPVFDTMVESAARLCDALDVAIFRRDGDQLLLVAHHGPIDVGRIGEFSLPLARGTVAGRTVLDGQTVHVTDMQAKSKEFPDSSENARRMGFRAILSVPLTREGSIIGTIQLRRTESRLFSERQVSLLQTFADQAVIAIENVRLFQELEVRNRDLTETLDQQTATGEILRAISASPTDVEPVFVSIAKSARRLCGGEFCQVFRVEAGQLHNVANDGHNADGLAAIRRSFPRPVDHGTSVGRAVLAGAVSQIADVHNDPGYAMADVALITTFRSLVAVPIMREGVPIGAIAVGRAQTGQFPERQVDLLKTFAEQAVIAIENVRLFKELEVRNRDLTDSLERQTATAEILRVISRSPTDVQPVFDIIGERARRLCDAEVTVVTRFDGELLHLVALHGVAPDGVQTVRDTFPMRLDAETVSARSVRRRDVVHIADVLADPEYQQKGAARAGGYRGCLAVPMMREGQVIGSIFVSRPEPGLFSDIQVELLKTFADQAVIAVQNVRLFNELEARNSDLSETLEQQTATGEILRVISSSPTDAQPVFDTIAQSAHRLLEAEYCFVFRFDGRVVHFAAQHGLSPDGVDAMRLVWPASPDRGSAVGRSILDRALVQIPDIGADADYRHGAVADAANFRSVLVVPMLRDGVPIGAITVNSPRVGTFPDRQVDLLKTFAEQAVIAIENVRLFNELEVRNRDLTETLEQQTATGEILRVISSSPTDTQPVFDTIASSAGRLCDARCFVFRFDEEKLHFVAQHGVSPDQVEAVRAAWPSAATRGSAVGRAVLDRGAVHIPDVALDRDYELGSVAQAGAWRATAAVPMLRDGAPIGAISILRPEPGPFSERQIELLRTFADQAVIAVENVRLFKELESRNLDLTETLQQQAATGEILRVISSSPTDIQPVLEAVAENSARLCEAYDAQIYRVEGQDLQLVASFGSIPSSPARPISRGWVTGRSVVDRRTTHVHDLAAESDAEYGIGKETQRRAGHRTTLATPLLREGQPLGAILIRRMEVRPFSEKQIKLLETFADQAVIAIENVRLFKELEVRNRDLTETLEQQTATGEILRVISSSPTDVQPVLETIVRNAVQLCDGLFGAAGMLEDGLIHVRAPYNHTPEALAAIRKGFPMRPDRSTLLGRAILDRSVAHLASVQDDPEYARLFANAQAWRGGLAVPMIRDGVPIGAIFVARAQVGLFSDRQVELLQTFADQAVIAIENVRLFKELEVRNRDLTQTLEQQTATSEILRVISGSPTDVTPVFETIVERARRLCEADSATVLTYDGALVRMGAMNQTNSEQADALRDAYPMPANRGHASGRAILTGRPVHIPDIREDAEYTLAGLRDTVGLRTLLSVPMMRGGQPIGCITMQRWGTPRPFSAKQMALVETFAEQAVIAIENTRLFKELDVRNRDLTETLEQQTATGEILRVISSSPTDVQPVFDTITQNAVRLCDGLFASVGMLENGRLDIAATHNYTPEALAATRRVFPMVPHRKQLLGRVILDRDVAHVPDIQADPDYATELAGYWRSGLAVPMIRDGAPIGGIFVARAQVGAFSERQIELLKTFADQAVIAIQNVRLFKELEVRNRDLTQTLEQQTATGEILRVISSSPTDVQPVFDIIVERAHRLCDSDSAALFTYDGALVHLAALNQTSPEQAQALRDPYPMPATHGHATGRAILTGSPVHIPDVREDSTYTMAALRDAVGLRTLLAVPMIREGAPIGTINVQRWGAPRPFSDNQVALLKTFAEQAVIAIENVRLFKELEVRNRDLTQTLEQQTATGEILRVISSSPTDVQPVFDTIAESAVRLCDGQLAFVLSFDGRHMQFASCHGLNPEALAAFRAVLPRPADDDSASGRAIARRAVVQIPDVAVDRAYGQAAVAQAAMYRSLLAVPILREGTPIGVITVGRRHTGSFPDRQVDLLKTFADQAIIAIENVRLFQELDARTKDLTRSVGELKALGEVSQAVSSTLDLETVLATIVSRAVQLSGCHSGIVYEYDEATETFHTRGTHAISTEHLEALRAAPIHLGEGAIGTAAAIQKPVQVPDIDDERQLVAPQVRSQLARQGLRSLLAMPLVREGRLFGGLVILRREVGQFAPEVLATMQTFAAQSVLAIQNARLFIEIQRQKQYSDVLVESSPVAIATMDLEGTVVGWNPGAERLFGYPPGEAIGRRMEDLVSTPEIQEDVRANVERTLAGEWIRDITRRVRKDGTMVDVEISSVPVMVEGARVGMIAIYHDITELLQARREAEAANDAKSSFLATMSHEIRTPMNAVIGMSGLLLNTSLSAEQREYAEIVRQSSDTLLTVINDILDFSKIEAGRLELETQPFDVRECVEGALDLVATRAAEKGLDLAYLLGEGTPGAIVGDVTRLRQVLLNLLSNAVKFTERGEIVLSVTTRRPDGPAGLAELTFSVRDTGIGIPEDRIGRLFQSFSQVDASTTRRYGGTGLGLAISQRLTELMGGRITVTSESGVGSEFRFTLRSAPATVPVPSRRDLSGVQPSLRGKRVLVVDDNATNRRILASHLEVWGMLARVSESPLEALGWLRAGERFDLGILDMHMPEMDGVALAHAIREQTDHPTMPLILFTSLGRREARAEEEGFAAYLHKPIKPSLLFDALISVLGDQPVHVPQRGTVRTDLDIEMATRHPLRILLAEDNVVNQKVATRLLGQMGYRADIAANGLEAVAAVERQTYDVVLMDVQMPEMDGFEASREINRRWPQKRPRIVAMTANAMEGDRELCVAAGMDDYVAKPIRVEELVAALGRCQAREDAAPRPAVVTAPTAPAADVVDRAVIDRLGESMGRDFAVELIDTFVADAQDLITALRRALAASDRDGFRRAAHTLKSTGESLGAFALAALARELESIGQAGRLHEVGNRVDRLTDLYERVAHALGAIRRDLGT